MEWEMADFARVPSPGDLDKTTLSDVRLVSPPGELDETYGLHTITDLGVFPLCMEA